MLDAREPVDLTLQLDDLNVEERVSKSNVRLKNSRKENMNSPRGKTPKGLKVAALFTRKGVHPFDEIEWERRKTVIKNDKGEVVFEENDVEVPKSWSMLAANVVSSKYFYGPRGSEVREKSVRQIVHRVARTIAYWGMRDN